MRRSSPSLAHAPIALVAALAFLASGCTEEPEPEPEVPNNAFCERVAAWDPAHAAYEREVLDAINERRAEGANCEGGGEFLTPAEPLRMQAELRCAARKHTLAMVDEDLFEHEIPEGETYSDRATAAGYAGEAVAQSIAAGQRDPSQVVATWMSNDANCANLMNPDATELGVGYRFGDPDTNEYGHYWTAVFGVGDGAP